MLFIIPAAPSHTTGHAMTLSSVEQPLRRICKTSQLASSVQWRYTVNRFSQSIEPTIIIMLRVQSAGDMATSVRTAPCLSEFKFIFLHIQ